MRNKEQDSNSVTAQLRKGTETGDNKCLSGGPKECSQHQNTLSEEVMLNYMGTKTVLRGGYSDRGKSQCKGPEDGNSSSLQK